MSTPSRHAPKQQPGGHPAVMSLQREVGIALDASASPDIRAASLSKLHAALATHKISRPSVAVALLPWFLSSWPHLVACLWDSNPQLPVAVAPLLGLVGGLVASSRAAAEAAAADTTDPAAAAAGTPAMTESTNAAGRSGAASSVTATAPGAPPVPPPGLLFDWLLPLLTGKVPLPTGMPAPPELQELVCKTLVYALQQLPRCTPAQTTASPSVTAAAQTPKEPVTVLAVPEAHPAPAGYRETAAVSVVDKVPQALNDTRRQQQLKPPPLLVAPVPPTAAQQVHQHATVTLAAVQELLESAATPPSLLAPLLQLLLEVFRVDVSVVTGTVLRDLLDLLLGWSLEPGLQPKDKQLITRVLSSCKQQWLAEPSLLQDVSSKLLADLQQQLPLTPAAADDSSESPSAGLEQQPPEEQQKFLTLLSCLIAILCAAVHEPSCQGVVTGTAELMMAAHTRFSTYAQNHDDFAACSAAANLAGLMLVLCRSAAAAQQVAAVGGVSEDTISGSELVSAGSVNDTDNTDGASGGAKDITSLIKNMWSTSLQSLQLQLLTAEDATALLGGMKATFLVLRAAAAKEEVSEQIETEGPGQQQQDPPTAEAHGRQHRWMTLLRSMPRTIFMSSYKIRCCGMAEVHAAAAALYTALLAVGGPCHCVDLQQSVLNAVLHEVTTISNVLHTSRTDNRQDKTTIGESEVQVQEQHQQDSLQQHSITPNRTSEITSPDLSSLQQQQVASILLFDMELIQAWINHCARYYQQQQQKSSPSATESTEAVFDGSSTPNVAAQVLIEGVVSVMYDLVQELLQGSSSDETLDTDALVMQATAILHEIVACYQAIAAAGRASGSASDSSNSISVNDAGPCRVAHLLELMQLIKQLVQPLLNCLKLLICHPDVNPYTQCLAVDLLPQLLLGPLQQQHSASQHQQPPAERHSVAVAAGPGHYILDDTAVVWHQVVMLLASAAGSNNARVRTSAITAASAVAAALWHQATSSAKHLLRLQPVLLQLLAAACSDMAPSVAAVAQAAVAGLAVPAYMLAIGTTGGRDDTWSTDSRQQSDVALVGAAGAAASSASAGMSVWRRAAALQPQQKLFKPLQLAQMFELLFQASPVLQRRAATAAQSIRPPPQQQHQAQADALYRLAQGLPPLPALAHSSKLGSRVPLASFDCLHSELAVRWLLLQEAARHCVNARLRTHFGSAPQSLAALERVINNTLTRLQTDDSPAAAQRSWQQQMMRQLQAALPQQQSPAEQQQQAGQEPQLLQAPVGGLVSRPAAAAGPQQALPQTSVPATTAEARRALEQQRLEAEAAAEALLEFLWALEVNIQSAAEGSLLRADVSKSVMAFFAGNKKVCGDWFARAREALLSLSAATGSVQHTVYHSMARLRELESGLRNLAAHYHTQQQQLQQQHQQQAERQQEQQQKQQAQQQPSSSKQTAAEAAAAAAISGLSGQQNEKNSRSDKQQGKQHLKKQQETVEQRRLKSKQLEVSAAPDSVTRKFDNSNNQQAATTTAAAAATQEKLTALQQHYQSSVRRLSCPVLAALVLLADALIASGQAAAVTGLQVWAHDAFLKVWKAISSLYALDISLDIADDFDLIDEPTEGRRASASQTSSTMLLLSWLSAAAAQAEGRLEAALGLYQRFLESQACQVPVGASLQGFIIEQMASCYAGAGDWQGLARLSSREAVLDALQQNSTTPTIRAHHWVLAGASAAGELQHWQTHAFAEQQQQLSQPHSHKAGIVSAGSTSLPAGAQSWQTVSNMLQQQSHSLTAAEQAILTALQVSSSCNSPPATADTRQQTHRGRGRGRGGSGSRHTAETAQPEPEASQQSEAAATVLANLQTELQQCQSNPLYISAAVTGFLDGSANTAVLQPSQKLQELALMQLLQETVSTNRVVEGNPHNGLLQSALAGWVQGTSMQQPEGRCESGDGSSKDAWSGLLTSCGKLRRGVCGVMRDAMPLVQVLTARDAKQQQQQAAGSLVLREALLASHEADCQGTLQRLLHLVETNCVNDPEEAQQQGWMQLVKSKLLLPSSGSCANSSAAQEAVVSHLRVLQPFWPLLSEDSISVSSSSLNSGPAVAAAYLSLTDLLKQGAAAPDGDWVQLLQSHWQQLQQHQQQEPLSLGGGSLSSGMESAAALTAAIPASQLPATACCAAAVAAAPASPTAWKAFGDLLYQHAAKLDSEPEQLPEISATTQNSLQQQQHLLYTSACNAYGSYLAIAVHAQALASPEQGLGVLLRLLHVGMEHGEALQSHLQQVFEAIPVSSWQVLTPQLLGLLQHHSKAVRTLVQQLLKGLALVVPCSVLYPLVVEVRAAEEAGQQPSAELSEVLSELQSRYPHLLADACAMASALAQLTVTPRESWASIMSELGVEINRKMLALQADAVRQSKQGLTLERRRELLAKRYHTVMAPVLSALQQHLAAAARAAPSSPDEAAFRLEMMPKLEGLAQQLKEPPAELLRVLEEPSSTTSNDTASKSKDEQKMGGAAATKSGIAAGGWEPLKRLQQQLAQQLRQQTRLELNAVAPVLAALKNTAIPLPADDMTASIPSLCLRAVLGAVGGDGAGSASALADCDSARTQQSKQRQPAVPGGALAAASSAGSSWLCIAGFDKTVLVLPTKTRPKRLRLLADDGSVHAFLLKGKDDLRVDQRVMQFIRTANALLAAADTQTASSESSRCTPRPRLRPYSVTPFGRRAGLVRWVRHTVSLYGLVRNWQTATAERYRAVAAAREVTATSSTAAAAAGASSTATDSGKATAAVAEAPGKASSTAAVNADGKEAEGGSRDGVVLPLMVATRPVDAFYARLLPALQAAGVPVGAPRKSWPVAALRSAFLSLQRESPRNLLHQQLLSSSDSPASWWSSQQRFTVSAATGSMIGWLLGLGDRHLDNLLLDTDSGELLHIDFSVCFDKGAGLGVPEVVPFRLTQMMQVALGPGGLAGAFSAAAGHVLSTLRQSSDMLSNLLALLLSDPAVDWSVEREAHAAKKDQDTAVSLRLFASRIEELRAPLLSGLAVALPTVGNGLAALVSYGEAHVYMQQMQSQAAAARARAAAAKTALSEASAGEVKALMDAANARNTVTAVTADYRRLCGLAVSCISSAANWLARHEQTLLTLSVTSISSRALCEGPGLGGAQEIRGLVAQPSDWDLAACDRPLMLTGPNVVGGIVGGVGSCGIIQQALLPLTAVTASSTLDLAALLPVELLEECCAVDAQGRQLLQQQARLMKLGRWAVGCYSLVLQQLLPGNYIEQSHHWCWSQAFTAAASGPYKSSAVMAAAVTPVASPVTADVASTWAFLATCWTMCQLQQQQHAAEVAAAAAVSSVEDLSSKDSELMQQLTLLAAQLGAASETHSAHVQLTASKALASVCEEVGMAVQKLQQILVGSQHLDQGKLHKTQDNLQQSLAALQVALSSYQQAGLSFILDATSSMMTDELPETAATLEELLDEHADDDQQLQQALQDQQRGLGQQYIWVSEVAEHLQVTQQLLSAIKHEALPPLAAWEAAAQYVQQVHGVAADDKAAEEQTSLVLLQAGPSSQVNLWTAAAKCINSCWQDLQQHLQYAQQLEQQIRSLAAIAAVGGAAQIPTEDTVLLTQADMLHQQLLPQGYDITYDEDCAMAAQLLQVQWRDAEQAFFTALGSGLCPLLGLTRLGLEHFLGPSVAGLGYDQLPTPDSQSLNVLQQLLAAAVASISSRAIMHCKDVFEALEGASTASSNGPLATDSSRDSGTKWGTPELSTAWKHLVVLLLQCGCAQQQTLSLQQQKDSLLDPAATAEVTETGVLDSSSPLPLDLDQYRPLVFVVEVLHKLLNASRGLAAAATKEAVAGACHSYLHVQVEGLLRPSLLRTLLQPLQQHLTRLRQHLQTLSLEAESVKNRHSSHEQQQWQQWSSQVEEHNGQAAAGQAGAVSTVAQHPDDGFGFLVPFDAFDPSLPGADMLLEESLGGLESSGQESENTAALDDDLAGEMVNAEAAALDTGLLEISESGPDSGLDWLDEEALQQQQKQGQISGSNNSHAPQEGAASGTGMMGDNWLPDLVPFDAFDPSLPGADALLEEDGVLVGSLEEPLEGDSVTTADEGLTHAESRTSRPDQSDDVVTSTSSHDILQWQSLGRLCWAVGTQKAHQLLLQQSLAGLQQVAATCAWQQQLWLRHLAAYEWVWNDVLQQQEQDAEGTQKMQTLLKHLVAKAADTSCIASANEAVAGLSAAANLMTAAVSGSLRVGTAYELYFLNLDHLQSLPQHPDSSGSAATLVPSRQQLLSAWQEVAESSPALEAGLSTWHAAAAATVAAVRDVIVKLASSGDHQLLGDPSICLKVLSGLCARCQSWCSGAADVLISLTQFSEAALQLEYSRRGTLWAPGAPTGVDAFQGNSALLGNLQTAIIAVTEAEAAVSAAEMLLASSQAAAHQAELTIEEAAAEQAVAEQELVLRTPAALARAQELPAMLNPMVQAAESALNLVTDNLSSMFKALSTLVERNSAARDLTPMVAETAAHMNRCLAVLTRLQDIGTAAATGLQEVLLQHQQGLTGHEQRDQQLLLQLLLAHMQPAVQGVQGELQELGQAHILLTQLTHQLDSLAAAAQTVSAAITAEHAVPLQENRNRPPLHADNTPVSLARNGSSIRKQRAEARRQAFAAAALQRCSARLTRNVGGGGADVPGAADSHSELLRSDVAGEVSELITKATSLDRLCRMYEGWMPWM